MKKSLFFFLLIILNYSCVEDHPALNTFTGDMIYSYLEKDSTYTEYVKIVKKAGLKGMLNAYGAYTCFAPNNSAFRKYYSKFGKNFSFDSLTAGQIDTLARTHIVQNKFMTTDLSNGVIPTVNMNKRFIEIKFSNDSITNNFIILLNDSSQIILRDQEVYNGVVHGLNQVLRPSVVQLPSLISKNPNLSIFAEALELTGLSDSLLLVTDLNYKPTKVFKDEYNGYEIVNPSERKFSYTALIEDNELLKANGINNLTELIERAKELYPSDSQYDNDFRNEHNSLNKYIAYHLVNKGVFLNKFFYTRAVAKGYTPDEFLETMYKYRIIRVSRISDEVTLNHESDQVVHVRKTGSQSTVNGVYHLLDNMLVYTNGVENMLQNIRIRFDIVSLFPEMTNNGIRASEGYMKVNNSSGDRFGFEQGYLTGITFNNFTRLIYLSGKNGQWANFQSDELMGLGSYDLTIRLLPVPPGTYELRFGYSAWERRSITQLYVDNKPVGIPLDLRKTASHPDIGYLPDASTEDNGYENDKMMRNRGYMKAPESYLVYGVSARNNATTFRRIVGTFTFTEYAAHTIRFRSVVDDDLKQCMMDYFEFVPKSVFSPASGEPESRD